MINFVEDTFLPSHVLSNRYFHSLCVVFCVVFVLYVCICVSYVMCCVVLCFRLRSLVEFGLYEHWLFSTLRHSRICRFAPSKITVRTSLAFSNLWGMFVLLGAGLQLATLVFCLEVVVGRRKSSPRTHTLSSKL
ncbi:putative variant ionotropic glutamate receptor-like 19 [Homarus americanus]|uniref:Putative variant ionotropic glutamate receptor-like 19 n=1 Tax=Homarus americanus TaxID=6706 RepID=A0A8J5NA19_HOMAM|nr:putative variant ionotropic glutamate receptor-like 19 [Homarus americanus]